MLLILSEWFGQSLSVPLLVVDIMFAVIGWIMALRLQNKKVIAGIMLTCVAAFIICCLLTLTSSEMFNVYAIFVGAMVFIIFVGALAGLLTRLIVKKLSR